MTAALSIANRLLAALAPEDLAALTPHFEHVELAQKQTLSKANTPIDDIYFVEEGMVSLIQALGNGTIIEVGIIGHEGFVGVPVLLGANSTPIEAMVQLPGSALRMGAGAFREEARQRPALFGLLLRYVQALQVQVSLSVGCNSRHLLSERLARWLLLARDRVATDHLPLNHEFLGMMLGVRRAGVTVALGALRNAGLIENGHGWITIIDRRGLEAACCECYRIVRNEYERLLPQPIRRPRAAAFPLRSSAEGI